MNLGFSIAPCFQQYSQNSTKNSEEFSGFGVKAAVFLKYFPLPRLIIMNEISGGFYPQLIQPSLGAIIGFVLHPIYQPFIGVGFHGNYNFSSSSNLQSGFTFAFSLIIGSQIYKYPSGDISLIARYVIYEKVKEMISSHFSIQIAYSFQL